MIFQVQKLKFLRLIPSLPRLRSAFECFCTGGTAKGTYRLSTERVDGGFVFSTERVNGGFVSWLVCWRGFLVSGCANCGRSLTSTNDILQSSRFQFITVYPDKGAGY